MDRPSFITILTLYTLFCINCNFGTLPNIINNKKVKVHCTCYVVYTLGVINFLVDQKDP